MTWVGSIHIRPILLQANGRTREGGNQDIHCSRDAEDGMVSICVLHIAIAVPSLTRCRKLNTSPSTVEDPSILKKMLTTPPVKKIDLHFPLGLEVTARNLKGVTIKDAMDAIHKQFKKKVLSNPNV